MKVVIISNDYYTELSSTHHSMHVQGMRCIILVVSFFALVSFADVDILGSLVVESMR